MVESDFGTELPKVTEQKSAEAAAVPPLSAQKKPPARKEEPPVAVAADFGSGAVPQRTDTAKPAYLRYTLPEQELYTPVSVEYAGREEDAAENRRTEQTHKLPVLKAVVPVSKQYGDPVQTSPKTLPNRIRDARTVAAPRDLYYVQPEEYKGGVTYREYGSVPEDYVNLIAQYEVVKQECESIERQMEEYARKHQYRNFADDSWYQALSAAHERVWERYNELEDARNADWWSRTGNVIAGSAKETAGQLISAAGTALEFIAQYGYHPAQIEAMNFNPLMDVPERDIALIKEYVTDPTRDFGDKLSQSGRTQVEEQKEGLGSFGRFAVDLGSAATELVLDLGLGVITGGGMAVPAAIRAFGGAATEARADGATLEEQMLYATTSAALSYGIESACNLAFKGLKAVNPSISDEFLTHSIEKMATKLASTPEGAQLLLKLGTVAVSGVSESGEEFVEAALEPFLKKLIYDPDAETILDDPSLFADYLYEAAIGGILGAVSGSVNVETNADTDAYVRTNADPGVESAVQQYIEAVQTGLEQNTDYQPAVDTQWEGLDPAELDFDPYKLFYTSEGDTASGTDTAADSLMPSDEIENAEEFEQSFLSGLQGDEESSIIQAERHEETAETTDTAKTAQTQSVAAETSADPGVEAVVQQYVEAVELFGGKTDPGVRSPASRSAKGDPAVHREAEAMIDRTSGEYKQNSHPEMATARSAVETDIYSPTETYPAENQVASRSTLDREQEAENKSSFGIVEIKAPPDATPDQIAQVQAYIDGCNEALKAGRLSKSGRVSTKGALRRKASKAAKNEAKRAQDDGTPYKGHVGHVPDTTWTGKAEPYRWQDLDPVVNTSLGGQTKKYPIGYKPTGFVFKEDE